jgi:hypothetical protein
MYNIKNDEHEHDRVNGGHGSMGREARNRNEYGGVEYMPTHRVNLDALIKRQDFERGVVSTIQGETPVFKLDELEMRKNFFRLLRKPDFQRTTNNWSPEMIVEFVRTFLDRELIPAIIIWHSQETEKIYLIDGAHRLSALIAWVNDDYGDGPISRQFFGDDIPALQRKLHNDTRQLMHNTIGSYADLILRAQNNPDNDTDISVRRGRVIATNIPPLQRVQGDAETAEKAFIRINESPAIIDPTELDIIKARRKPNTIATRALMQAGKGYQYWARFGDKGAEISTLASEVHDLLFGSVVEISTQSPDVPRAGQPYSAEAFKMVFDMVNIFNEVSPAMWQRPESKVRRGPKQAAEPLRDDTDGTLTLAFLERVKRVARFVNDTNYPGSLGLDPAVYSYGATGKFHPGAFLASLKFAQELKNENKLSEFTEVRADFEEFLVRHKYFINQLGHSKGSRLRPLDSMLTMYKKIMDALIDGRRAGIRMHDGDIIDRLRSDLRLKDLKEKELGEDAKDDPNATRRTKFSKTVQAAAVVREILENRARCPICGARFPPHARSKDHVVRKEDGGLGSLDNLQFTHAYCNEGYKEAQVARERRLQPQS